MRGEQRSDTDAQRRGARLAALVVTAVFGALILGTRLGGHPLWDPDEAKHAEVAREMLVEGRAIEPLINFEPYHHKPSGLYLVIGAAFRVFGVGELGARLPSAVCAWLTLLAVCAYGGRARALEGLLAALLLGSCGLFVLVGRFTNFDAALTFFTTLAILALVRLVESRRARDALLLHASTALAVLVKGPAALALIAVPIGVAFLRGDLEVRDLQLRRGVPLAAAILGVWLVPALVRAPGYVAEFLWVHNVERYLAPVGADVFHPQPFWFFLPVLAGALLPWSAWLPAAVVSALTTHADRSTRLLAAYGVWVVVFFSLSSGKLATYILPAVPAFALVVARWLVAARDDAYAGRRASLLAAWVCVVLCPLAYLYARSETPAVASYAWVFLPVSVAGVAAALAWRRFTSFRAATVLSLGMATAVFAFNTFAASAVSPFVSDADLAARARAHGKPRRVIAYRVRPFSFLFYTGWPMQYRVPLDEVRKALYEPGEALLLSEDRWLFHLEEAAPGVEFTEIARNPRHVLYTVRSPWN